MTLKFLPLLHRFQIFIWAGDTQYEGEVQNSSSYLQVGQKYATYHLGGMIWALFKNFDQPIVELPTLKSDGRIYPCT